MNCLEIIEKKILDRDSLAEWKLLCKKNNQTIVFTNGCFDVLHYGHINYLSKANDLGDKLIIGLNSDSSVKRLKGKNRPINDINARAAMLASLFMVDAVVVFDEDTPESLIKSIVPNVLVKGGDYIIDNIVGADFVVDNGGILKIIPFVDGFSTTGLLEKL
jgi:rfaE bifunctional protein nucleotidyltransferase chain/domain